MQYRVLGPLEVRDGEESLPLAGAKQRALLALLLLHANRVLSRDRLIDELWGDEPPATAVTSLQVYISRLRKLLPAGALLTRPPGYLLEVEPDELDLQRFERLVAEGHDALAEGNAERAADVLHRALALWRGPALAEFTFEPFAQAEIRRLEDLRLAAVEERIEADLALGRHAEVIGELEALIAENPHRERLQGELILALYRSGRQAEALDAYRDARHALVEELGIEPSAQLQKLEKAILTRDPALETAPAKVRPKPTNLPLQRSPLVGRERELAEVLELLEANQLVTLTGAGGSGKTRLALEAAAHLVKDFPGGVWFVSLAAVKDPDLVEPTIAQVLGAQGPLDAFLHGKRLLLLLDNLEQLLPGVAPTVAGLDANVLATSRERLNLTGEQEYPVPTLPLDDAVALFTQRARQLQPAFEADEHAARIARRLDGLPLAIELAAARVNVLSAAAILERLDKRLPLLTGGTSDAPERQRTLRATIDWSYELLTTEERGLFARLAVFAGGCTLAGAEEVCAAELDTLASLVDKSLLLHRGERYSMLETIREYALERLEELGQRDRVSRALTEYLIKLVEASPAYRGVSPFSDARLADELDNMRTALAWALVAPEPELALRLASEAVYFSRGGNILPEESRWLDEALRAAGSTSPQAYARALEQAASVACALGDFERSQTLGEQALRLYQELRDGPSCIHVLGRLGDAASGTGDYTRAKAWYEESFELAERLSEVSVYKAIHRLGEFELASDGDLHRAAKLFERCLTLARAAKDHWYLTHILHSSGDVALAQGDHGGALSFYRDALRLSRQMYEWRTAVYCVAALAAVAALAGDTSRAGRLSGACETLELELGWRVLENEAKRYDAALAVCSNADPIGFATAAERGRRMSVEEIVAYALNDTD
jgi:predicted ATPase/DNA-binding SARP family transcriptional activator